MSKKDKVRSIEKIRHCPCCGIDLTKNDDDATIERYEAIVNFIVSDVNLDKSKKTLEFNEINNSEDFHSGEKVSVNDEDYFRCAMCKKPLKKDGKYYTDEEIVLILQNSEI